MKSVPFPYIDSLDDARLRELRKKTVVGCDPNKHRLLVGVSLKPGKDIGSVQTVKGQPKFAAGDVDVWRYTNGQRRFDANMPLVQRRPCSACGASCAGDERWRCHWPVRPSHPPFSGSPCLALNLATIR